MAVQFEDFHASFEQGLKELTSVISKETITAAYVREYLHFCVYKRWVF